MFSNFFLSTATLVCTFTPISAKRESSLSRIFLGSRSRGMHISSLPPIFSDASNRSTVWPLRPSCHAAERPPGPPPMIAIAWPVDLAFFGALRFSAADPYSLMFKGWSILPRVQSVMQRLGQTVPQTVAGSGLYWSTSARASAVVPCRIRVARLCDGIRDGQAEAQGGRYLSFLHTGFHLRSSP